MSTMKGEPLTDGVDHETNKTEAHRGHTRLQSKPADVSILKQSVTFAFSGQTAKNRFLKAPMTERLCHWNKEGEDIVRTKVFYHSTSTDLYQVRSRRSQP